MKKKEEKEEPYRYIVTNPVRRPLITYFSAAKTKPKEIPKPKPPFRVPVTHYFKPPGKPFPWG